MSQRGFRTTTGGWISLKKAHKLDRRGRIRWHAGYVVEIIEDVAPAELNRSLAVIPRVHHAPNLYDRLVHHANCQDPDWVELRSAYPVTPEWLKRMGYLVFGERNT